jgi:GT2 family glycosyltransferase
MGMLDLSILIPTYKRPDQLLRCLESLADQSCAGSFEVIVGVDGGEGAVALTDVPGTLAGRVRIESFPKMGLISLRHRMLAMARGRIFLSLNDDVQARPGLIDAHLDAHSAGPKRVVAGVAPWKPIESPNLFDRIIERTGIIFFPPPKDRAHGYRDCYGLNMSAPVGLAREFGGFPDVRDAYGYDDTELAYRLQVAGGAEIVFRSDAAVIHDHRMTPRDVLKREYLLGRSAWTYAELNPGFARALFGRDIRTSEEVGHARWVLENDRRDAARAERHFIKLAEQPPDAVPSSLLETLADSWLCLKRYLWRWGMVDSADGVPMRWSELGAGCIG